MSRAFRRGDTSPARSAAAKHKDDESEYFQDLRKEASKTRVNIADVDADDYFGELSPIDLTGLNNTLAKKVRERLNHERREIRLLEILDDDANEEISCRILVYSLDDAPPYTAVSYTWGAANANCTIQVNGHGFSVRKNIWRFLVQMRNQPDRGSRKFWIDALCINQADPLERTHQVSMMAHIFQSARQVYVWLGPAYDQSDLAMRRLSKIKTWKQDFWSRPEASALRSLLQRPYWERLWVFQELVLATDVVILCGSKSVSWNSFANFVLGVVSGGDQAGPREKQNYEYDMSIKSSAFYMFQLVRDAKAQSEQLGLFDHVVRSRKLHCSEPRDRVYALLSVVQPKEDTLTPDYLISLPELVANILRLQHTAVPPNGLDDVEQQCRELASVLGISSLAVFSLENESSVVGPQQKMNPFETEYCQKGKMSRNGTLYWWAAFYNLKQVKDICEARKIFRLQPLMVEVARTGHCSVMQALISLPPHAGVAGEFIELGQSGLKVRRFSFLLPVIIAATLSHQWSIRTQLLDSLDKHFDVSCNSYEFDNDFNDPYGSNDSNDSDHSNNSSYASDLYYSSDSYYSNDPHAPWMRKIDIETLKAAASKGDEGIVRGMLMLGNTRLAPESPNCKFTDEDSPVPDWLHQLRRPILLGACRDALSSHNLGTALGAAAMNGHDDIVGLLVRCKETDVNKMVMFSGSEYSIGPGHTPLHAAVAKGHQKVVKWLLECERVDVHAGCETRRGDFSIRSLLKSTMTIRLPPFLITERFKTPLHAAAALGNSGITKLLVECARVDVNAAYKMTRKSSPVHWTPLHEAISSGYQDIVRILLSSPRLNINANRRKFEPSLLHIAAEVPTLSPEVLRLLLESGKCGINHLDPQGRHAVHLVAHNVSPKTAENRIEALRVLLEYPRLDVNAREKGTYDTALHIAIRSQKPAFVEALLTCERTEVNMKNRAGNTALSLAIELEKVNIQALLIRTGKGDLSLVKDSLLRQSRCVEVQEARSALEGSLVRKNKSMRTRTASRSSV
jgi:ankyrin repeat protein